MTVPILYHFRNPLSYFHFRYHSIISPLIDILLKFPQFCTADNNEVTNTRGKKLYFTYTLPPYFLISSTFIEDYCSHYFDFTGFSSDWCFRLRNCGFPYGYFRLLHGSILRKKAYNKLLARVPDWSFPHGVGWWFVEYRECDRFQLPNQVSLLLRNQATVYLTKLVFASNWMFRL